MLTNQAVTSRPLRGLALGLEFEDTGHLTTLVDVVPKLTVITRILRLSNQGAGEHLAITAVLRYEVGSSGGV